MKHYPGNFFIRFVCPMPGGDLPLESDDFDTSDEAKVAAWELTRCNPGIDPKNIEIIQEA